MPSTHTLPEHYIAFLSLHGDAPNKVFIKGLFNQLNKDGLLGRFMDMLLDKKRSRSLKSAVSVLATERVKMPNTYRHYPELLPINGQGYYLSSQWNKPQRDTLLHWLNSEVFKPLTSREQ